MTASLPIRRAARTGTGSCTLSSRTSGESPISVAREAMKSIAALLYLLPSHGTRILMARSPGSLRSVYAAAAGALA